MGFGERGIEIRVGGGAGRNDGGRIEMADVAKTAGVTPERD